MSETGKYRKFSAQQNTEIVLGVERTVFSFRVWMQHVAATRELAKLVRAAVRALDDENGADVQNLGAPMATPSPSMPRSAGGRTPGCP